MNIYGIKEELLSLMSEEHKQILFDFIKSFEEVYSDIISHEEIIARINNLNYIGFETEDRKLSLGTDGQFFEMGPNGKEILISKSHENGPKENIKSLIYHELIHAISYHSEIDNDYCNNQPIFRTGLNRDFPLFSSIESDDFIEENETLEEIMTEYYNTVLLRHEGINMSGKHTIESFCFGRTYVDYYGTGYHSIANLGQIYDYLFGQELLKAKFVDGNNFRNNFDEIFKSTGIFTDIMEEEFASQYSRFVTEKGVINRYKTACKMFMELIKNKYSNMEFDINEFANSPEIEKFRDMLIKTQMYNDDPTVLKELDDLMYKLEFELVQELSSKDNHMHTEITDDQVIVYRIIKQLLQSGERIELQGIKFSNFVTYTNGSKINGIILNVNNDRYLVDTDTFEFTKFRNFDDELKPQMSYLQIDLNKAEYATLYRHSGITSIISDKNQYFDYKGEPINILPKTNLIDDSVTTEYVEVQQTLPEIQELINQAEQEKDSTTLTQINGSGRAR